MHRGRIMHRGRTVRRSIVALVAFALIVTACGDDDAVTTTSPTATSSAADATTTQPTAPTTEATTTTTAPEVSETFDLIVGLNDEIPNLDPSLSLTSWVSAVHLNNVSETLTTLNADGDLVPLLATSWELVDEDTWRFQLEEGVLFHNGEKFNAEVVVVSLDLLTDPDRGVVHGGFFAAYDSSEVVNEYTVDVHTLGTTPHFPSLLTFAAMVPPEHQRSSPTALNDEGVGTGPYLLESRSASQVVLHKNHDYWGGVPEGPETVTLLPRPEVSARIAALQADELDIVDDVPAHLVEQVPALRRGAPLEMISILINPTLDPLVREAIVLAIDNEGIREALLGDLGLPGLCQIGVPGVVGFNEALDNQGYDPERARELLEEAGQVGMTLRFLPGPGRVAGEEAAEVAAAQLEEVGFDVDLVFEVFETWITAVKLPPADRVELFLASPSYDSGTLFQPIGPYVVEGGALWSFPHAEYPDFGGDIVDAQSTIDVDALSSKLDAITQTMCDANMAAFLYAPAPIWGMGSDIVFPERNDFRTPWADVRLISSH